MRNCRKMALLGLFLGLLLPLTACGRLPQSREMGTTAVVGVLGVEWGDRSTLAVYAGSESRAGEPPSVYRGEARTLAGAIETLSNSGDAIVTCAHVEHILLADAASAALEDVVSYAFRDPRQSTESQLWVVKAEELGEVFAPEQDPAQRMSVLRSAGKDQIGFASLTLRETAMALAAEEPLLVPALDMTEGGLTFGGYGLYQQGRFVAWLEEREALGAALLMGRPICWTDSVQGQSLSLRSTGCKVSPRWQQGELAGLDIRCRLEGAVTGGWQDGAAAATQLELQTARTMAQALGRLQSLSADPCGLKARAGLGDRMAWRALCTQWEAAYPALPAHITVTITLAQ